MGIETNHINDYRYPGTKFFEPDQQQIFFGREQETRDLVYSIKAYDVFVIFADSGIGKTSLLNAGLIPELEKENYEPVKFRFQDVAVAPLKVIDDTLSDYNQISQAGTSTGEINLWRLFKSCNFKNKLPLFIFDQFEEFFNHPKPAREKCIDELAGLINEYLPDNIRQEMKAKFREQDPTPEQEKYYTRARVKVVFLIRADKLKLLDDLSIKIPFILKNRFYLRPLSGKQAEQAILLPALLPKNGFVSPSFSFEEKAVAEICDYLKNEEGEVESFQLQILCRELEKRIISRSQKLEKGLWITSAELGGEAGMDAITKNYYTNQVNAIPDAEMRAKAIELIEDKLIVENRRISLPEILLIKEGYSKELLDYLLNTTRIIRVYNDRNSRYYEISHDRLLPSIIKLKQQRQEEETRLAGIIELDRLKKMEEEKTAELNKEKVIKKRFRIFAGVMGALCLVLLLSFVYIIHLDTDSKIANARYFNSVQIYDSSLAILEANNIFSILDFANKETLTKLRNSARVHVYYMKMYNDNLKQADSLVTRAEQSYIVADSLINQVFDESDYSSSQVLTADFSNLLLQSLKGSSLLKARKLFITAQKVNFRPLNDSNKVEYKLSNLDTRIGVFFGQNIYAILVFAKYKMKPEAIQAFKNATLISSTAYTDSITLNSQAKCVLDSLQNILKQ